MRSKREYRPDWSKLPREARFGVGLRRPHFDGILEDNEGVDFLEIVSENFMDFGGRPRKVLTEALNRWPVILHGVSLSIGSLDPLNEKYLSHLQKLIEFARPKWFSDHLSYSSAFGVEYSDLIPLPFTEEVVNHVVGRVKKVQNRMGIPFLLENPSYYAEMPGAEMNEAQFMKEISERADCGILLDVNNIWVNATNHGYDPYEYVDAIPAERVFQYHIAGHDDFGEFLVDTHGSHISPDVYRLYRYALQKIGPAWTLLEWDNNIPSLEVLLRENRRVRDAHEAVLGAPGTAGSRGSAAELHAEAGR